MAKEWVIAPAKQVNPKVSLILKFPQWYDCFHLYGYNVETEPRIFDRIWVGTETRNPDTQRFGFVQPTMGYDNFRWLASIGGDKVQGAWFDALDCHEDVYLMQAYQSVLASAKHLTLFNLGEYMEKNPVLRKFKKRREAILQLAKIVDNRQPLGLGAYKPPHSSPQRDLYLFDFLSVLGIPIVPVGRVEAIDPFPSILLSGHAKGDSNLLKHLRSFEGPQAKTCLWTPSFAPEHTLDQIISASALLINDHLVKTDLKMRFIKVHPPEENQILATIVHPEEDSPVLMKDRTTSGLIGWFLNVFTYSYDDLAKVEEMFLPPSPLAIPHWPRELADRIRAELPFGLPVHVSADPPFGLNLYEGGTVVISNFSGSIKEVLLSLDRPVASLSLHPDFDHAEGVYLENMGDSSYRLRLPGWEIAVLQMEGD